MAEASDACELCQGKGVSLNKERLKRKNIQITAATKKNVSILSAAYLGHEKCLEALIKEGADVNVREVAFDVDYRKQIRAKTGLEWNESIGNQFTVFPPLLHAAENGHVKCADMLIKAETDVNFSDGKNFALCRAANRGQAECVELLISAGADVNKISHPGAIGFSSLTYAAYGDSLKCVELLLAAGADVNHRDRFGGTPLMAAAEEGKEGCVKLLLKAGADVNIRSQKGETALKNAKKNCVQMLKDAGAKM